MSQSNNPLQKYFRQPAVYLTLPSKGKNYPDGALATQGNLPVYPMTALDEIALKTPDALYNGTSMVSLIKSCIPDIKDPWSVPTTDFDSILLAIKMASFGNDLELETTCPKCSESSSYSTDLGVLLSSIKAPDYDESYKLDELEIWFQPLTYKQISENAIWQASQQRLIAYLSDNNEMSEDEKTQKLTDIMIEVTKATIDVTAKTIAVIKTPDAVVRDTQQIKEFLSNCKQSIFEPIKNKSIEIRQQGNLKPFDIECSSCHHAYQQPFVLDQSNFFA